MLILFKLIFHLFKFIQTQIELQLLLHVVSTNQKHLTIHMINMESIENVTSKDDKTK